MKNKFRCTCPVTSALDILGDKWMLVIIKQMLILKKKTYKDFINSDEGIATNILTNKLKLLLEFKIILKIKLSHNKKSAYYYLTQKGLSLTPVIIELLIWGEENIRNIHPKMAMNDGLENLKLDKGQFIDSLKSNYTNFLKNEEVEF